MRYRFMTSDVDIDAGYDTFGLTINDSSPYWPDKVRAAIDKQSTPAHRIGWYIVDPETGELECIGTADEL